MRKGSTALQGGVRSGEDPRPEGQSQRHHQGHPRPDHERGQGSSEGGPLHGDVQKEVSQGASSPDRLLAPPYPARDSRKELPSWQISASQPTECRATVSAVELLT